MKNLAKILENLTDYEVREAIPALDITGVDHDSRRVRPGFIFVCREGEKFDGHNFIDNAIANGAKVIVVSKDVKEKVGVVYIKVKDSQQALGQLSEAMYDFPARKLTLIGVTGTNGKTTTTYMVDSILRAAGFKTGVIGTIQVKVGDEILPTERTTPEPSDLHYYFAKMVEKGVTHAIMEVSSHALKLKRVADLRFRVGIFTNLTQDHLDFHPTAQDYMESKGKLFHSLTEDGVGIINADADAEAAKIGADGISEYMKAQCKGKYLTYGILHDADIKASDIDMGFRGVSYTVTTPKGSTRLELNLTGKFNVYNSLDAIGAGLALGIPLETIKIGLEDLVGVAGRFEAVDEGQDFGVIVDYAHTPDGMENVLKTAKEVSKGRKIVVFGCGGDRDRTKRPVMGQMGVEHSDFAILTSDNPRTEDPKQILNDIEKGIQGMEGTYCVIPDRREAIYRAVREANAGDLVLILGKGHEDYQIIGTEKTHFDDREEARKAIQSLQGV